MFSTRKLVGALAVLATNAAGHSADRLSAVIRTVRRILIEGLRTEDKEAFASLGVNFLAPLTEMPGMPPGQEWTRLVEELVQDWNLTPLPILSRSRQKPEHSSGGELDKSRDGTTSLRRHY